MQDLLLALDRLVRKSASAPWNRPSAVRVAQRAVLARIDPGMDLLARLSFLEGVAEGQGKHVKPGTWMNKGRRGFKDAQKVFPNLNPEWASTKNAGFFQAGLNGMSKFIPDEATATRLYGSSLDALVSDFMQGINPFTGARVKPVFYEVGLTLLSSDEIEALAEGTLRPSASGIKGALAQKFAMRTIDIFRAQKSRVRQQQRVSPTTTEGRPRPGLEGEGVVTNALFQELRKRNSPLADRIRTLLKEMVRREMKNEAAESFAAFLDVIKGHAQLPTAGGKVLPGAWAKEVAKAVDKTESAVRANVFRVLKWLEKNGQKSPLFPALQKLVDHIENVGALGISSRSAHHTSVKRATAEIFSEWLVAEKAAVGEEFEVRGETTRTHDVGPFTITTVKYPDAPRGGYRFSAERVSARWLANKKV